MTYERFMQDVYERLHQELVLVLKDLSEKDLDYRPGPQSNSIGWLLWHSIRSEDRMNADLFGEEQLWIRGQWYAKFNRAADAKDTGMRHTNEQVAAFRSPHVQTYLDYAEAVFARTREYLQTRLSEEDLERKIASPKARLPPLPNGSSARSTTFSTSARRVMSKACSKASAGTGGNPSLLQAGL